MIEGFRHTGIAVRDMDAALAFYRGLLGLTLVSDRVSAESGNVAGAPGIGARICLLEVPGSGTGIELLEYRGGDGTAAAGRPSDRGAAHASFWVGDLTALYERLVQEKVRVLSPPRAGSSGRKKFYACDPDGFWIELTQAESAPTS